MITIRKCRRNKEYSQDKHNRTTDTQNTKSKAESLRHDLVAGWLTVGRDRTCNAVLSGTRDAVPSGNILIYYLYLLFAIFFLALL